MSTENLPFNIGDGPTRSRAVPAAPSKEFQKVEMDQDEYTFPDDFPGELRDGVIFLPGDNTEFVAGLFKHVEHVGGTLKSHRYMTFKPTNPKANMITVGTVLEEHMQKIMFSSHVKVDWVGEDRIGILCSKARLDILMMNLMASAVFQGVQNRVNNQNIYD